MVCIPDEIGTSWNRCLTVLESIPSLSVWMGGIGIQHPSVMEMSFGSPSKLWNLQQILIDIKAAATCTLRCRRSSGLWKMSSAKHLGHASGVRMWRTPHIQAVKIIYLKWSFCSNKKWRGWSKSTLRVGLCPGVRGSGRRWCSMWWVCWDPDILTSITHVSSFISFNLLLLMFTYQLKWNMNYSITLPLSKACNPMTTMCYEILNYLSTRLLLQKNVLCW